VRTSADASRPVGGQSGRMDSSYAVYWNEGAGARFAGAARPGTGLRGARRVHRARRPDARPRSLRRHHVGLVRTRTAPCGAEGRAGARDRQRRRARRASRARRSAQGRRAARLT
jgi:hypothetical protein